MTTFDSKDIIVESDSVTSANIVGIETESDAKVIVSEFLEEVRGSEQGLAAASVGFSQLVRRAIYSINRETENPNDPNLYDSILPHVENQSGSALERIQTLSDALISALDIIAQDPEWKSLLDEQDDDFITLESE